MVLDNDQSLYDEKAGFPIRHTGDGDWGCCQQFVCHYDNIDNVHLYLRKFGSPIEFDLVVELRDTDMSGQLLDSVSFTPAQISSNFYWLETGLSYDHSSQSCSGNIDFQSFYKFCFGSNCLAGLQ